MTASQATEPESLVPELRSFVETAEAQIRDVTDLLEPLADAQIRWRPAPERWSVGEHIAHLTIANRPYLAAIEAAITTARHRGWLAPPPYRHGRLGNLFIRSLEPPPRFRARTVKRLVPPAELPRSEVVSGFVNTQLQAMAVAKAANGIDLGRASIRSPYMRVLRLSVGQAFAVIAAHNRRHIWLARQVTQEPGFDRSGRAAPPGTAR